MNQISQLTRELTTEYEALTGRKLTPPEYLQFREQAMLELQNGFHPVFEAHENMEPKIQKVAERIVPNVQTITPIINDSVVSKSPERKIPEQMIEIKQTKQESDILEDNDEEDDPFFALIDRFEA